MKKIVVLGCGYLGYNIAEILYKKGARVTVIGIENEYASLLNEGIKFFNCDLLDDQIYNNIDFDEAVVVNAIGSINAKNSIDDLIADLDFYKLFVKIVTSLNNKNVYRFIQISSGGTVYGNPGNFPIKESQPVDPLNIYALQKVYFEQFLKVNYLENKSLPYTIARIANPYGGYQSFNKQQGIIPIAIRKILHDEAIDVWTSLDVVRDYIYITDLVDAIKILFEEDELKNKVVNIGNGKGTSTKELFEKIEKICRKKLKINFVSPKQITIMKNVLDISLIKKYGYTEKVDIQSGIQLELNRIKKILKI